MGDMVDISAGNDGTERDPNPHNLPVARPIESGAVMIILRAQQLQPHEFTPHS
jgi:hypothetical protein